jgi:hypothetical protein
MVNDIKLLNINQSNIAITIFGSNLKWIVVGNRCFLIAAINR